ncbi:protein kinase domain-containing protein [Peterkaempfera bronchialis]|uniref:serine/threonine-protein kinase n=1 Tax=Peterkaempfera bronchialis TaxID=2126346 RepID=UPI003C2B37C3
MRPVGSKYLIEEALGRGATGTVWRGRVRDDATVPGTQPGQQVAVKVLREELAGDPDVVMRFLRERSVLLRLSHPNIVRVRDLVVEGDLLALVMDLVDGPDLYRYLRSNGPLSPVAGALLMAQVADALAASHADGVVHRDLKPANVLLATTGEPGGGELMHPMLTDFGIARLADSPGITRTHEFVGTPAYVAPESAEGRPQTSAVDVYGAGIMLYELVTGRPPFQGDGPLAILHAHLAQEPERPGTMPEPLWTVVERCLRKEPRERPGATALAQALRVVAVGIGVHSTPAQVDEALAVGALLLPDPEPAPVPGTGGAFGGLGLGAAGVLGDGPHADPTQVLGRAGLPGATPTEAGGAQYDPAAATRLMGAPGAAPGYGSEDRTRTMPASGPASGPDGGQGDRTRVMPPVGPDGPDGQDGPQPEQPHPWQTQLRAARDRNQQTEVGYFEPEELRQLQEPQVAPPPFQYGRDPRRQNPQQNPQQNPGYGYPQQGGDPQQSGYPQQGGDPRRGAAPGHRRPQAAPPPYQQPYEQSYEPAPAPAPQRPPARRAEPAPARRAEPAPARRQEAAPPREAAPHREPREPREPRPRSRNRMYIPGLGCLKGCLMVLLILAIAAAALWNFTPLPQWWDHAYDLIDRSSTWVSQHWHSLTS